MKKLIFFSIILIIFHKESFTQDFLGVGGYIGGGVISGNTTGKGSFSSSLFVEVDPGFYKDLALRISFLYNTDFNSILPNSTKRYYPFIKGFGLKGITFQKIDPNLFVEEGIGLITLNDKTISGTNVWDYGVNFSIAAGFDLRNIKKSGFKISLGTEYGLTFFRTLPTYFTLHLQAEYFL
jgi:hypothetical protein